MNEWRSATNWEALKAQGEGWTVNRLENGEWLEQRSHNAEFPAHYDYLIREPECGCVTDGSGRCPAEDFPFTCSREPGHAGGHVACCVETSDHRLHAWPQTPAAPPKPVPVALCAATPPPVGQGKCAVCDFEGRQADCPSREAPAAPAVPPKPEPNDHSFPPELEYRIRKPSPWPCVCMRNGELTCDVSDNGWSCTREPEHDGKHIACGLSTQLVRQHRLHTWPQAPAVPPKPEPEPEDPPLPTPDELAALRYNGRKVRLVGRCERPGANDTWANALNSKHGRSNRTLHGALTAAHLFGGRRHILEAAPEPEPGMVVTEYRLAKAGERGWDSRLTQWFTAKKDFEACEFWIAEPGAVEPEDPPLPTPDELAALRYNGRKVRLVGRCGRPGANDIWDSFKSKHVRANAVLRGVLSATHNRHFGGRRHILEAAPEPEPGMVVTEYRPAKMGERYWHGRSWITATMDYDSPSWIAEPVAVAREAEYPIEWPGGRYRPGSHMRHYSVYATPVGRTNDAAGRTLFGFKHADGRVYSEPVLPPVESLPTWGIRMADIKPGKAGQLSYALTAVYVMQDK